MNKTSPVRISESRITEVADLFAPEHFDHSPPPWIDPPEIAGISLFPTENDRESLGFFLLLGALNYSYWQWDGEQVSTWGGFVDGKRVEDVFALCYCLMRARSQGTLSFESSSYLDMDEETLCTIFSFNNNCDIPMFATRLKKIRKLGEGLERFAQISGDTASFSSLLRSYRTFPAVLDALEEFFPYCFGDPFRKLSQLLLKMIMDRSVDPKTDQKPIFPTSHTWRESTRFLTNEYLRAQPDDMLPLFCLKTGLWELNDELETIFRESRSLPMDHPLEVQIREVTMETVDRIAEEIDVEEGTQPHGHVDSVMWQTAVQGCFPVECEGCTFNEKCDAVNGRNNRLDWAHHRTRTIHY